jgi:hypothetical protein
MTFKKIALITALLIGSITAAAAGPNSYNQQSQIDRSVDVGEGGGGGAGS